MNYLKTGCNTIDNLFGGGIPVGQLSGMHSLPNLGKTIFSLQCAYSFLAQFPDKEALIIDTEGMPLENNPLNKVFKERFNTDRDPEVRRCVGLDQLFNLFGSEVDFDYSDSGKIEKLSITRIKKTNPKKDRVIKDWSKYGFVSIDSFSEPFKQMLAGETKNFPARSNIETNLCGRLQFLAESNQMIVWTNHHTSKNPTDMMDLGTISGGTAIQYQLKYLIQLLPPDKSVRSVYGNEGRRVIMRRMPFVMTSFEKETVLLKENFGFTDP